MTKAQLATIAAFASADPERLPLHYVHTVELFGGRAWTLATDGMALAALNRWPANPEHTRIPARKSVPAWDPATKVPNFAAVCREPKAKHRLKVSAVEAAFRELPAAIAEWKAKPKRDRERGKPTVTVGPVKIDARYLAKAAKFFGKEQPAAFAEDDLSPLILTAAVKYCVIMPMRLA